MTSRNHREVEIKLRADGVDCSAADVLRLADTLGLSLVERGAIEQVDVYLDDARFHLTRAGVGLRVRTSPSGRVLCVKTEIRKRDRAFTRDEVEVDLGASPPARSRDLPKAVRDRVEPFVMGAKLRAIAGLRTRRQRLDSDSLEIALDHVVVHAGSGEHIGSFAEVEIELRNGARLPTAEALAEAMRNEIGLVDSQRNKLQRALGLQHIDLTGDRRGRVGPDLPIREAARRTLAKHFRRLQREEVRVRTSKSAESVHKLRVACRRMRATLRTFRQWIPSEDRRAFRVALRTTATAFGEVRDLDVLGEDLTSRLDRVPESLRGPARRVIARLQKRSARLRDAGRRALRRPERLDAIRRLQEFVEAEPFCTGAPTVREVAPGLIHDAAEAAFAHGRTVGSAAPAPALHELRILLKRLRYTAESFVDAYGKDLSRFVERTTHLQEVLGEFNDAEIAAATLDRVFRAVGDRRRPRRREQRAIGALLQLEHLRGCEARRRFQSVWSEFDTEDLRTWLDAVLRTPIRS